MNRRQQFQYRKRGAWLRTAAPVVMLLTIPCYCIGFSVITWNRLIVPAAQQLGSRALDWLFTPVGLVVTVLVLLVLLTEPFHGGVTNVGALGIEIATSFDPAGCMIILALLFLLGMGLVLWLTEIDPAIDAAALMELLRPIVTMVRNWIEQLLNEIDWNQVPL